MAIIDSVKLPDNSTYDVADNYSGYAKKVASATTDDLASLTATGDLADSGKKLSDLVLKSSIVSSLTSTATDVPLAANMGKTLEDNKAEKSLINNRNLLDNWYFIGGGSQQGGNKFPINSRALTSYPAGTGYTIDRWTLDSAGNNPSLTVDSDGITLTHYSVVGTYSLFQYIDDYAQYIGKTFTVSFLGSLLEGSGFSIVAWYHPFTTDWRGDYKAFTSLTNDIASLTFTVPNDAEGLAIIIASLDSYSPYKVKFKAAKLELGNYQTLAHKESGSWVLNDMERF